MIARTLIALTAVAGAGFAADSSGGSSPGTQPNQSLFIVSYDANHDGRIDRKELDAITAQPLRDYVLYFDKDKSGVIDAGELSGISSKQAIDELMTRFDKNQDQMLDQNELKAGNDQHLQQFFTMHDRNRDQLLTRAELSEQKSGGSSSGMEPGSSSGVSGDSDTWVDDDAVIAPATPGVDYDYDVDVERRDIDPEERTLEQLEPSPESPSGD